MKLRRMVGGHVGDTDLHVPKIAMRALMSHFNGEEKGMRG